MKRKIYSKLLEWKRERSTKESLLIDGAHRVGKSYIVEEFLTLTAVFFNVCNLLKINIV